MSISNSHALGRQANYFAKIETTAGTLDNPYAAANAIKCLPGGTGFDLQIARDDVDEARATRSLEERTTNKRTVSWTYAGYMRPSGAAGTAPDLDPILVGAFNKDGTNVGSTSETYNLADTQTLQTLSIGAEYSGQVSETVWGAVVNQFTLTGSGGDRPQFQASGPAMNYAFTGRAVVTGSHGAGATFDVTAASLEEIEVGSIIEFDDGQDNSGAGFEVTGISSATVTISPNHAGLSGGEECLPLAVTGTYAGTPIPGIAGSLTVGGTSYPLRGYTITIDNQITEVADEVGQAGTTDFIPGFRVVSGSFDFRSRSDMLELFGNRRAFSTFNTVLTIGDTAGSIITVTMPAVEFEFSAFERSAEDSLLFSLPFRALASTAPDEIKIAFT